eukprot:TRINITY_DN4140_c1_g1_i2.p1 TRINITY_DN4140_c1_g1~~TRINITY_DN4140_c1_g1_i2.p1  ORF type:complete len:404 (-),score=119.08 TRINITY_DN4140_c1_g1_i2:92-1303(-)
MQLNPIVIRLADFDRSTIIKPCDKMGRSQVMSEIEGSPYYMAPEVLVSSKEGYTANSDSYGIGMVLFEMLARDLKLGFSINDLEDLFSLHRLFATGEVLTQSVAQCLSPECVGALRCLLCTASKRLYPCELLQHPWIAGYIDVNSENNLEKNCCSGTGTAQTPTVFAESESESPRTTTTATESLIETRNSSSLSSHSQNSPKSSNSISLPTSKCLKNSNNSRKESNSQGLTEINISGSKTKADNENSNVNVNINEQEHRLINLMGSSQSSQKQTQQLSQLSFEDSSIHNIPQPCRPSVCNRCSSPRIQTFDASCSSKNLSSSSRSNHKICEERINNGNGSDCLYNNGGCCSSSSSGNKKSGNSSGSNGSNKRSIENSPSSSPSPSPSPSLKHSEGNEKTSKLD